MQYIFGSYFVMIHVPRMTKIKAQTNLISGKAQFPTEKGQCSFLGLIKTLILRMWALPYDLIAF